MHTFEQAFREGVAAGNSVLRQHAGLPESPSDEVVPNWALIQAEKRFNTSYNPSVIGEQGFPELARIGIQASLPYVNGIGFIPVGIKEAAYPEQAIRMINLDYDHLPKTEEEIYRGMANLLTEFLGLVVDAERDVDERVFLEGREIVYQGMVHGKFGNPDRMYSHETDDYIRKLHDVKRQYDAYETYPSDLGRADENVINLGFLALRRPDVFPWISERFWKGEKNQTYGYILPWSAQFGHEEYIVNETGISEGEMRGMAAVKRVVKLKGKQSELQQAILAR